MLAGSSDCGCRLNPGSSYIHARGSGSPHDEMRLDAVALPRGAAWSVTRYGTHYYTDGNGVKVFQNLPILLTRMSMKMTAADATKEHGYRTNAKPSSTSTLAQPPPGAIVTDPEFESALILGKAAFGVIAFSSAYAPYTPTFQPLGAMMNDGTNETARPGSASKVDARTLSMYNTTGQTVSPGTPVVEIPLHAQGGNRRSVHAAKVPMVRLPNDGANGLSWSFAHRVWSKTALTTATQSLATIQVYGLWSMTTA